MVAAALPSAAQTGDPAGPGGLESLQAKADALAREIEDTNAALADIRNRTLATERKAVEYKARLQKVLPALEEQAASWVRSGTAPFESILSDPAHAVQKIELYDVLMYRSSSVVEEARVSSEGYQSSLQTLQRLGAEQRALLPKLNRALAQVKALWKQQARNLIAAGGTVDGRSMGLNLVVNGQSCPLGPAHSFIDSWHAPRVGHLHQGTDIMAPFGVPVYAMKTGTVYKAGNIGGLAGLAVMIHHAGGVDTWSFHLNSVSVRAGQRVLAGTQIGTNGSSGNAQEGAEHVHFEYHVNGVAENPYPHLTQVC